MAKVKALAHLREGLVPGQVGEVSDERARHLVGTGAAEYAEAPRARRAPRKPREPKRG